MSESQDADLAEKPKEQVRSAASVILLREGGKGVEVYLLRRHRKASFMASSYVFPGGICDPGEDDPRTTAARELFEESGVLLSTAQSSAEQRALWRSQLNVERLALAQTPLAESLDVNGLQYYSHWITPSLEKRRYSATFYVALMPQGQTASPDNKETVDEVWVRPAEALERSDELCLPPPQLRTFLELVEPAKEGIAGILKAAQARAEHPHALLPRACESKEGITLLMPWDAQYQSHGQGDQLDMPKDHALAWGPTRFVLGDAGWIHTHGPSK